MDRCRRVRGMTSSENGRNECGRTPHGLAGRPTLLPLKATKAKLNLKVSGDMGQIEILGAKEATELVLQTRKSPAGSISFEIESRRTRWKFHRMAESDSVSGPALFRTRRLEAPVDLMAGNAKSYWRIESLSLELSGVTTDQPVKE